MTVDKPSDMSYTDTMLEWVDMYDIIKEGNMILKGMSVRDTAQALGVTERTIFRMLGDGRLKATKLDLPDGRYVWDIDTLSVAKLIVRKEVEEQIKQEVMSKIKKHRRIKNNG